MPLSRWNNLQLLIVLNGIETKETEHSVYVDKLLIVLNGIETWKDEQAREIQDLLIVLNGIETPGQLARLEAEHAFNRTKWN